MTAPKYTHGHHESVLRAHRARTALNSAAYLLPSLTPGLQLLDVGCGPGTITADLAGIVAPGRVTAIEPVPEALDLARACARNEGRTTSSSWSPTCTHCSSPTTASTWCMPIRCCSMSQTR